MSTNLFTTLRTEELRGRRYLVNGVRFTKELRDRIYTNNITFREIMQFKNIEQRRAAIEYIGMNALLIGTSFKLLDESMRGNRLYVSTESYLSKYRRPEWIFFLAYECPSTCRPYVSPVDANEIVDRLDRHQHFMVHEKLINLAHNRRRPRLNLNGFLADSAMAWKLSLTLDEYRSITAEA